MRISELVSDWELEEIRDELRHGNKPEFVAYRHGIPTTAVRQMKPRGDQTKFENKWTFEEKQFVRDNYPNHGRGWKGWEFVGRHSWDSIRQIAHKMGVRRKSMQTNERWRKANGALMRPRQQRRES